VKWLAVGLAGALHGLSVITQVSVPQPELTAFLHPDSDPQGAGFQLGFSRSSPRLWAVSRA